MTAVTRERERPIVLAPEEVRAALDGRLTERAEDVWVWVLGVRRVE